MSLPPDPEVMAQVGALIRAKKIPQAIDLARRELDRGVAHPQLLHLRSTWLESQGRHLEALTDLERAHHLDPNEVAVLMALGFLLEQLSRPLPARRVFERAAALRPDLPGPMMQVGWVSENVGQVERACAAYEAVLEIEPGHARALGRLATIAAQQGEWTKARALAVQALQVAPEEVAANLAHTRADIQERMFDEAEQRLLALLARPLSPEDTHLTRHVLGALRHVQGRYDEAFAAWTAGNETARGKHSARYLGARGASGLLGAMTAHVTDQAAWKPSAQPAQAATPRTHVFLMGFARSGTTLLEQVLASHPDVVATDEREVMGAVESYWATPEGLDRLRDAPEDELASLRELYWEGMAEFGFEPAGKVFIDKSPFNALRLPIIARAFPDAKVLFALRDPRDVVFSCFRTHFRTNVLTFELLRIEDAAKFYAGYMELARLYREKLPLDLVTLRHEDLLDDFEGKVREVCEFIGIDLQPQMLDFARSKRRVATPSAHQLRDGLSRKGAGQWKHYARQMAPALPHLAPWVERFGYA